MYDWLVSPLALLRPSLQLFLCIRDLNDSAHAADLIRIIDGPDTCAGGLVAGGLVEVFENTTLLVLTPLQWTIPSLSICCTLGHNRLWVLLNISLPVRTTCSLLINSNNKLLTTIDNCGRWRWQQHHNDNTNACGLRRAFLIVSDYRMICWRCLLHCNDHVLSWIIGRNIPKCTVPVFQCEAYIMCPIHWE